MMPSDGHEYAGSQFANLVGAGTAVADAAFFDCTFQRCSFVEAVFERCSFVGCAFRHCDMSLLRVPNSNFTDITIHDSKLVGVDWTKAGAVSSRMPLSINFYATVVNYSSFFGLDLTGMEMLSCSALEVDFAEASLKGAKLHATDFLGSTFLHTDLTSADFTGARNYAIDARANTLTRATFTLPEAVSLLRSLDINVE